MLKRRMKNKQNLNKFTFIIILFAVLITLMLIKDASAGIHEEIDEYIKKNELEDAKKIARKAYKKNPEDPESICALACVYASMSYNEGLNIKEKQYSFDIEKYKTAKITKADLEQIVIPSYNLEQKYFSQAEKLYYDIIKLDKNYINSYYYLLSLYVSMGNMEKYFQVIDLIIKNIDKKDNPDLRLMDIVNNLFRAGYLENAIKLYKIINKQYPDSNVINFGYGMICYASGDIDKAVTQFQKVYSFEKTNYLNISSLADAYILQENYKDAFVLFEDLVKDKKYQDRYFEMGLLSYYLNKNYKQYFEKVIEHIKDMPENNIIRVTREFLNIKDMSKEEKEKFLAFLMMQFYSGKLYSNSLILASILMKDNINKDALLAKMSIYEEINYTKKGFEYIEKICEYRKKDDSFLDTDFISFNYGRLYYMMGSYKESIKHFLKVHEKRKDDIFINYLLGIDYLLIDNRKDAIKFFKLNSDIKEKEKETDINIAKMNKTKKNEYKQKMMFLDRSETILKVLQ